MVETLHREEHPPARRAAGADFLGRTPEEGLAPPAHKNNSSLAPLALFIPEIVASLWMINKISPFGHE
jgi:hypothetical protein